MPADASIYAQFLRPARPAGQNALLELTRVKPAAPQLSGDFTQAASRAGLPDDYGTLNEILDLMNQGHAADDAAQAVRARRGLGPQIGNARPLGADPGVFSAHLKRPSWG